MDLTINGTPITVDQIAAQEIVRRHILNQPEERAVDLRLAFALDFGQLGLKPSEKLIGTYSGPDGNLTAAILLPGEKSGINWKDALQWAKDQGGDLPNRVEALLLFQHHRNEFQREVYWTNEPADGSSCAWSQSFRYGNQLYWRQDFKLMARAVRRVAI